MPSSRKKRPSSNDGPPDNEKEGGSTPKIPPRRKIADDDSPTPEGDAGDAGSEGSPETGINKDRLFEHGDFETVRPTRLSLDHQKPATGFQASTVIEGEAPSFEAPPPPKPLPLITPLAEKAKAIKAAIDRRVSSAFPNAPKYLIGTITVTTTLFLGITIAGTAKLTYDRFFAPPKPEVAPVLNDQLPLPPNALTIEAEQGAYAAIKAYVEADGIDAKKQFIRHPEKSVGAMRDWYSDPRSASDASANKAGEVLLRKRLSIAGHDVIALAVDVFPSGVTRFFLVERQDTDTYKIDWESSSGYQPMRLEDFQEKKPTDPVPFRVHARRSDYYNFGFTEDKYDAYRLNYPTKPEFVLYAYADKLTATATEIQSYLPPGVNNSASLILDLAYPEDAKSDEHVIIKNLVLPHWLED